MNEYAKLKNFLTERSSEFTDDGQIVQAVLPSIYAEKFTPFLKRKIPMEEILCTLK
jgi:hypothetical protein